MGNIRPVIFVDFVQGVYKQGLARCMESSDEKQRLILERLARMVKATESLSEPTRAPVVYSRRDYDQYREENALLGKRRLLHDAWDGFKKKKREPERGKEMYEMMEGILRKKYSELQKKIHDLRWEISDELDRSKRERLERERIERESDMEKDRCRRSGWH